jgi:hypothetical protein
MKILWNVAVELIVPEDRHLKKAGAAQKEHFGQPQALNKAISLYNRHMRRLYNEKLVPS